MSHFGKLSFLYPSGYFFPQGNFFLNNALKATMSYLGRLYSVKLATVIPILK